MEPTSIFLRLFLSLTKSTNNHERGMRVEYRNGTCFDHHFLMHKECLA